MTNAEKKVINQEELAGIQYFGGAGTTDECLDGIKRLLHYGDIIREAKLLTRIEEEDKTGSSKSHAFILKINYGDNVAIKSGFGSGYSGTGAHGLSIALQLLVRHGAEIYEHEVDESFFSRLDRSCLLASDLEKLENSKPIIPWRYTNYIIPYLPNDCRRRYDNETLKLEFPATIPFRILDERLIDLALNFFENPDSALLTAFRRLEGNIRKRASIDAKVGIRLFSEAFQGENSVLYWEDKDQGEHVAKAKMFEAIYGAYRNPRSHIEESWNEEDYLREFLLINELFLLEKAAVKRPPLESANEKSVA